MTVLSAFALPLLAEFLPTSKFKSTFCFHTGWFHFRHDFDFQLLERNKATEQGHKYSENEMTEHLTEGIRSFGSISRPTVFWPTRLRPYEKMAFPMHMNKIQ